MKGPAIGAPIDRVDGRLKVTGEATYAADVPVAGVAHAVIVTSQIARGKLVGIDVRAARRSQGVLAVITHDNAPQVAARSQRPMQRVLQLLQDDDIHYADQPIAVVVADTLERAQHAAALIGPRYHAEAAMAALESGIGAAYTPNTAGPHGPATSSRGDVDHALATATHKLQLTYTTPNENHNPMEPHATIAVWQGADHLTLYDATQGIFGVRDRLAEVFGIPKDNVRVVNHYVGGGFGCKGSAWSHVGLCALAAKVVQRPVKLVITRPQMFSLVGHRPHTVQTIAIGCDAGGNLVGIRHDVVSETSQFDEFVEPAAMQTRMLYACDNVATKQELVRIDVPTPTFQRAPGLSTGTYAIECAMDELAYAAKLDPLELRLRNYAEVDGGERKPFSSKSLRECYRAAAERFGWARRSPAPRSIRNGRELVGYGMATATYPAHVWPQASARAKLRRDGTVVVQAGTQDIGTGTYTVMTQIAADALGMPLDKIVFELGDTAFPENGVSGGSTTASTVGPAVKAACEALKNKMAGARPGEELSAEATTKVHPDRDSYSTHAFGADFVEVRVDEDLGRIRVVRAVAAFAAGTILNAKTARSQLIGGLVWAIGMALEEATVRDRRTARVVTRDLADYHVPVNADVPALDVIIIPETDAIVNDLGTKGIGELGITGAAAAIANAVYHATGKRIRDLPITLDKLL